MPPFAAAWLYGSRKNVLLRAALSPIVKEIKPVRYACTGFSFGA
jgi:hypothetical protein